MLKQFVFEVLRHYTIFYLFRTFNYIFECRHYYSFYISMLVAKFKHKTKRIKTPTCTLLTVNTKVFNWGATSILNTKNFFLFFVKPKITQPFQQKNKMLNPLQILCPIVSYKSAARLFKEGREGELIVRIVLWIYETVSNQWFFLPVPLTFSHKHFLSLSPFSLSEFQVFMMLL